MFPKAYHLIAGNIVPPLEAVNFLIGAKIFLLEIVFVHKITFE